MMAYEVTEPGLIKIKIPKPETPEPARPKFSFKRAGEMTAKPQPENWLVKGLMPKESLGLIFGAPASGKSLAITDIGFCMAAGLDWEGRPIEQGDVVIIAGEGFYGYSKRLKALEEKYGTKAPMNLAISEQAAQLNDPASCDDVAQAIRESGLQPKLIIIDTLNRNFCADENSSKEIALLMANLEQFFKPFGATIVIVHHSGHGTEQRSRGSSAIRGALDFEYGVFKDDGNNVVISNHKAKDFEPPKPLGFVLKPVKLNWLNDDGEQQTSVYLEYTGEEIKTTKKTKLNARQQQIMQSLTDALNQKGIEPTAEIQQKYAITGTGTFKNIVRLEDWRPYAYKAIPADAKNPSRDFKEARDKFLSLGLMMEHDGYVWRIEPSSKKGTAGLDTTMLDDPAQTTATTKTTDPIQVDYKNEKCSDVDYKNDLLENSVDFFEDFETTSPLQKIKESLNANSDKALSSSLQETTSDYKNENCSEVETTYTTHTLRVCSDVVDPTNSILSGSLVDDVEEF